MDEGLVAGLFLDPLQTGPMFRRMLGAAKYGNNMSEAMSVAAVSKGAQDDEADEAA